MGRDLRQSTASQEVPLGEFLDSGDGNTQETGLTINASDILLHKSGATSLVAKNSGGATHMSGGVYVTTLDATDTNTLGPLTIHVHVSGALAVKEVCNVLAAVVYDVKYGTVKPQTTSDAAPSVTGAVGSVGAGGIAAASFAAGAIDAAAIAANAIGASELAADAVAEIADAVWDEARAGHVAAGTFGEGVNVTAIATGAINAAALAADAGAEIADAVWDEVMSGHVTVGTFGQRLQDIRTGTAQTGAATTITLDAAASASDDFYNNCLIVITSGQGANQARFISDYVGATKVATVNSAWIGSNPNNTSVFMIMPFGSIPGATAPTAAEVADAVWDEDATAHQTQGTFGQAIGDPGADTDSIWALANTNLNATVSSRASQTSVDTIDDFLDTEISTLLTQTGAAALRAALGLAGANLDTQLSGIQADTDNLQSRVPTALVGGRMDASVGAMAANTLTASAVASDAVTELQSGLSTLSAAQVNAEVLDVLNTDTFAELAQGAPPAAPTLRQMLHYLYMLKVRNRVTQTSSQLSLFADNGTTVLWKAAVTDNGTTLDRAEAVTGP